MPYGSSDESASGAVGNSLASWASSLVAASILPSRRKTLARSQRTMTESLGDTASHRLAMSILPAWYAAQASRSAS